MKKNLSKIIIIIALAGLIIPNIGEARNLSELKAIKLVSYEDINYKCFQGEGYDPISGCYLYEPVREIYIRNDLPLSRFIWVFWHEIGHFLMEGTTDEQYNAIFNSTPQKRSNVIISEIAAETFALWMIGGKVPENQKQFFIKLLTDK